MSEPVLISRQQLIRTFGFSATLVESLGPPDYIRANPHWGNTHFYDLARVEVFAEEHAARIARIVATRRRRQESARHVISRRRAETLEWSRTVTIILEPISPSAFERARRYFAPQPLTRERALLYLQLHYTNYLECVSLAAGRCNANEARLVLRERVEEMLNEVVAAQSIALLAPPN